MHKASDIAKRLDIHPNTVRVWADQYRQFMSAGAVSARRKFSDGDLRTLATIAELRGQGILAEDIAAALTNGARTDTLPPEPSPDEERARQSVALVPRAEVERGLDELERVRGELTLARAERDKLLTQYTTDTTALNQRIVDLSLQVGRLEGNLKRLESERPPASFWLRIIAGVLVAAAVVVVVAVVVVLVAGR